ncbi:NAD(P)-dependent oxidoreductase [Falsochrobactrum sp. TDYN1]|uniref:NAD(P)-dependent oxidoreductase n=1 Tax=Falsochrobactrum tianjinense TaxID=2706015 RepID=A0A949UUU3_9HYPH|nr:NAD(P)-dependent oxidoreductase [Falsochrobactrum sp. TDYN1]MBV2143428.1 NAD(P)-dependent oxidoreductase [Falsochrobactrum sp. TDYN1]
MSRPFQKILITGAAGRLGTELRRGLAGLADTLVLADRIETKNLKANEQALVFELSDAEAVMNATKGVDAIVHFGGAPLEVEWETILGSNIQGSYNIYEGARKNNVKRIVYASSVHAIGYHTLEDHIDTTAPVRPDSLYGVSKCFVEALSRLYWDKFGIETACLRIFSSFPEPTDRRMLWSWLSFEDCIRLVAASLMAPKVGHTIAFGISDNAIKPVDNSKAGHLGYVSQDNTEAYRAAVEAKHPVADPNAPSVNFLGGWFVDIGHPNDEAKK